MEFTLDDASTSLRYSDNWDVQSSNDTLSAQFFQSTYHATVSDGASVNLTFLGTGISLYGSKGPRHAQFIVFFDGTAEVLNAQAPETAFRQLLFQTTFANSTNSTEHLVSLVVQPVNNQTWFDLDFITFSADDRGTAPPASSPSLGLTPPWATSTSALDLSSDENRLSPSTYRSAVIALSTILGLLIITLTALGIYTLHRRRTLTRERSFRYGSASPSSSAPMAPSRSPDSEPQYERARAGTAPWLTFANSYPFTRRQGASSSSTGLHQMEYRSGSQVDVDAYVPRLAGRAFFARLAGARDPGTGARVRDDDSSVGPFVQI